MDERFINLLIGGLLATFGGIGMYLYQTMKPNSEDLSLRGFALTGFLALVVGIMVASFIPDTIAGRDGLIVAAGILSLRVFEFFEKKGLDIIKGIITIPKK